jgi:hypothetical protein
MAAISAESASEVSGPVAMMTAPPREAGTRGTSPRTISMSGCPASAAVTCPAKTLAVDGQRGASRDARAIGRRHDERPEPPHLLLQQPDGVVELVAAEGVAAHELGEPSVLCTAVGRTGRISWRRTRTPRAAACQAASLPARPPPMMVSIPTCYVLRATCCVPGRANVRRATAGRRATGWATGECCDGCGPSRRRATCGDVLGRRDGQRPLERSSESSTPRCCRAAAARGAW